MGSSTSVVGCLTNELAGFFKGNAEKLISSAKVLTVGDLDCMHVCSGTTVDYPVYLPKPSECAGKLVGFRMDPGLTKLVTLDAGQTDNVKSGTVQVWSGQRLTLYPNSAWTMQFPSCPYTGTNWKQRDSLNYAAVHVGDRINWNSYMQAYPNDTVTEYSRYVATIDTSGWSTFTQSFTWNQHNGYGGTTTQGNGVDNDLNAGNVDQTGIIGTGTTFLTDLTVGGLMWVGGVSRTVAAIIDDTHCAVTVPFPTTGSGLTYSMSGTPFTIDGEQKRIMWANEVAILYSDGYKWTKITGKTIPMMASLRLNGNQTAAIGTLTVIAWDYVMTDNTKCPAAMIGSLPYIYALRPGVFHVDVTIQINDDNASASYNMVNIQTVTIGGVNTTWLWHYEQTKTSNTRAVRQLSTNLKLANSGDRIQACFKYDSGSSAKCLQGFTEQNYCSNNISVAEIPTW